MHLLGAIRSLRTKVCWLSLVPALLWYLMVPPPVGRGGIDDQAPVWKWARLQTYNSNAECQADQTDRQEKAQGATADSEEKHAQVLLQLERSRCLSADDPELTPAR